MVAAGARTLPRLLKEQHANLDEVFEEILSDLINSYKFEMMNSLHQYDDEGILDNFIPSAFKRTFSKHNSPYNYGRR